MTKQSSKRPHDENIRDLVRTELKRINSCDTIGGILKWLPTMLNKVSLHPKASLVLSKLEEQQHQ